MELERRIGKAAAADGLEIYAVQCRHQASELGDEPCPSTAILSVDEIRRLIESCRVLKAMEQDRIVGVLATCRQEDTEQVLHLWVPDFYANRITAARLLHEAERSTTCAWIRLTATHRDPRCFKLYTKESYHIEREEPLQDMRNNALQTKTLIKRLQFPANVEW